MDAKYQATDNPFIERWFRTIKQKHIYLHQAKNGLELYQGVAKFVRKYNARPHLSIPDNMRVEEITLADLPPNWHIFPPGEQTQVLGDAFIRKALAAVCKVPSSLLEGEFNYLINPSHPKSKHLKIIKTIELNMSRWLSANTP